MNNRMPCVAPMAAMILRIVPRLSSMGLNGVGQAELTFNSSAISPQVSMDLFSG
jgi:hypothetical protein